MTGASSGIGRALACQLAEQHARLLLVARRESVLQQLAEELLTLGAAEAIACPGDLTDPQIRQSAVQQAQTLWGGLDLLVNNAGVSAHGTFVESDEPTLRQIMELNFFAAVELTRLAVPLLQSGNEPLVVNVGSVLGHRGVPHNSEYCASKFALRGFSEAVRPELNRAGIGLLLVSPGTTDTEFFDHLLAKRGNIPWSQQCGMPPEAVARQIVRAIQRRQREIFPNWRTRLLVLVNRFCPGLVDWWMNRYG